MIKGLTEKGIRRLGENGYKIETIQQGKSTKSFKVSKKGKNILEIHFDSANEEILDLDELSGTISVAEGYVYFKKIISIYVTNEGLVLDYEDEKSKNRTVREKGQGWIL